MGKKKKTTIGYKYYMGLHMGLCRGPVDAVKQIRVGDKPAWVGHVTSNSTVQIDKPNLFGGDEQEGGIKGSLDVMMGAPDQPKNTKLAAMLGGLVSAFRGVTTTFFDGLVCAMSPYPKEWAYMVQKTKAGWYQDACWYPEKCEIEVLSGSIELLGAGWEYVVETFSEPNTVWDDFTAPTTGWQMGAEMPFTTNGTSGGTYWTPYRSNIWLRRQIKVNSVGATAHFGADNGCVLWVNGELIGTSNATNEDIPSNQNNPVSYTFAATGVVDILVKAFAEKTSSDVGNVMTLSFSGVDVQTMNPAHILRRLYTDPIIGRGLPASRLDEASWTAAADTFYAEGVGLCLKWSRTSSIADFAGIVIDHCGAVLYTSRRTGKIVLKPIRDDYNVNDLPLFTPDTGLIGFDDDQSAAQTTGVNEIVVKYFDPIEKQDKAVREKNLGAIMAAGGVTVTEEVEYPGIPTEGLARRVARRDLNAKSGFLKRFTVRLDRRGADIMPGHVFRISDTSRGISNLVLRAGRVEFGTPTDGTITVTAIQDVFGLPSAVYRAPEENGYQPPDTSLRAASIQATMEAPYRDLVQSMAQADFDARTAGGGYLYAAAIAPTPMSMAFELNTRVSPAEYVPISAAGDFCPGGTLADPIGYLDTTITLASPSALDQIELGTAALIGDEIVRVDAVDVGTAELTIARGCADTVPAKHAAGTPVLCYESTGASDPTEYLDGVTVDAKLLTQTGGGILALGAAPTKAVTFDNRADRPYPPGLLKINGEQYPDEISGDVSVTWAHRDRVTQADLLVDTTQASTGPETGTTYTVEYYTEAGSTPLATESGISGTAATDWTPMSDGVYRVELYSVRDSLESWQRHVHTFLAGVPIWTPANLTTAPKVWIDWDSSVTDVGGHASEISNRGSLGGKFAQSTSSARPEIVASGINGLRLLRFDANDYAEGSTETRDLIRDTDHAWIFALAKRTAADSSDVLRPIMVVSLPASSNYNLSLLMGESSSGDRNKLEAGGRRVASDSFARAITTGSVVGDWVIGFGELDYSARQVRLYKDGSHIATTSGAFGSAGRTADSAAQKVCIGSNALSVPNAFFDGDIAVVIASGASISTDERRRLEGWAASRAALQSSLPVDHPFRHAAPYVNTPALQPDFGTSEPAFGFVSATNGGSIGLAVGPAVATEYGTIFDPGPSLGSGEGITVETTSGTLTIRLDGLTPPSGETQATLMTHKGAVLETLSLSDMSGYFEATGTTELDDQAVYYVVIGAP